MAYKSMRIWTDPEPGDRLCKMTRKRGRVYIVVTKVSRGNCFIVSTREQPEPQVYQKRVSRAVYASREEWAALAWQGWVPAEDNN